MRRRLVAALLAGVAVSGCGGSGDAPTPASTSASTDTEPTASVEFAGGTVDPVLPAPELGLRRWNGPLVRIADYRGSVTLVTFVYATCPDICPLIVNTLIRVKDQLGPDATRVRIVAVSVDPEGDTPETVRRFLAARRATGKVDYLIGPRQKLEATWARWGIAAGVDRDNPDLIEHSGAIWGVDPQGRRVTFYPATGFDADDIAKDVRTMLASTPKVK